MAYFETFLYGSCFLSEIIINEQIDYGQRMESYFTESGGLLDIFPGLQHLQVLLKRDSLKVTLVLWPICLRRP